MFDDDRITIQYVTVGFLPWSAALIGAVEALHEDVVTPNRLCPPVVFTGNAADVPALALAGLQGQIARASDPALDAWTGPAG